MESRRVAASGHGGCQYGFDLSTFVSVWRGQRVVSDVPQPLILMLVVVAAEKGAEIFTVAGVKRDQNMGWTTT